MLSHRFRSAQAGTNVSVITTDWMENFVHDARLPTTKAQAANLIRIIGEQFAENGDCYFINATIDYARIGALNPQMFAQLFHELESKNLVKGMFTKEVTNPQGGGILTGTTYGLTLDGWDRYEAEKIGKFSSKYGFIAMKFGDLELDKFVENIVKPIVKSEVSFDVVHMRDVGRAGLIDNIMRQQIRDAAFVLVDLTHDNSGAYWEAGYAEGLGKPVIYICERKKFDETKTHFDTNHSTTVMWSEDKTEEFKKELIATLRRSLNLFPTIEKG